MSQFCACDFFILCLAMFKYFKRVDISASLPDPKGHKITMVVCITTKIMTGHCTEHFSSIATYITLSNILVDVVSYYHRVYSNNDSTVDSTSHVIAHDDFTRSRNLAIGLLRKCNNHRYY